MTHSFQPAHDQDAPGGETELDLSKSRQEYSEASLDVADLLDDPFKQFERWYADAVNSRLVEPNAMTLATVSSGKPTQRTVLLKYFDHQGLVFFTNYNSRKSQAISSNGNVSLLFPWLSIRRQVEVNGSAHRVPAWESLKYFSSRPRGSQLGAWASAQSGAVSSRSLLEAKWLEMKTKFAQGKIPLPSFWGGFRVRPVRFEFWQGRPNRLHDRFEYLSGKDGWTLGRLNP